MSTGKKPGKRSRFDAWLAAWWDARQAASDAGRDASRAQPESVENAEAVISQAAIREAPSDDAPIDEATTGEAVVGEAPVGARAVGIIGEAELEDLRVVLAPISESYLRTLLRESGVPLAPLVAGVRQSNLDELEDSLIALAGEYENRDEPGRTAVRQLVITAKDHARWSLKRASIQPQVASKPVASDKEEMILWMITWLENPTVFRQWIALRRQQI